MSNVDERVVKMTFDNKSFESNAKETMSTLDKLKSALQFDNVSKSFDKIGEAAKKVDLSPMGEAAQAVTAKFSTLQIVGYTAISNITNRMMNFAHRTVGGMFSQVVQGGINRAFNIEKAKFTIEGLGKDWKKLEKDINYGVSGTAYGFDEAAMAASSMAASGVKAGDDMSHALLAISGMAAMTGSSFTDISNIFTTVAGNGRILSQQLNQFSSRGLNAAATLRDYINADDELRKRLIDKGLKSSMAKQVKEFQNSTKLTEQNVRSLVSGSVIDFKTFSNAMHDAFGKQAKAANKTFNGVMSNIKATLSRIGEAFVHPLIANNDMDNMLEMVDSPLRQIINRTKEVRKLTKDSNKEFFDNIRKISKFEKMSNSEIRAEYKKNPKEFIKQYGEILGYSEETAGILKNQMRSTSDVFVDETKNATRTFFEEVRTIKQYENKTDKELMAEFKKNPKEFAKQVQTLEGHRKDSVRDIKDIIQLYNSSDKTLKKLYGNYSKAQYNIVGVLQAIKRAFGVIESTVKNSTFLKTFHKTASRVCKALILLFNGLAATFGDVEKKGKKFVEIVGQKSHLVSADKIWKRFRKTLGMSKDDFRNLRATVKGVFAVFDIFKEVVKQVVDAFSPAGKAASSFGSIILAVTGYVGRLLQDFRDYIQESGIIKQMVAPIKNAMTTLADVMAVARDVVVKFFKSFYKSEGLKKFGESIVTLWKSIQKFWITIQKVGDAFKKAILKPFKEGKKETSLLGGVFDKVFSVLGGGVLLLAGGLQKAVAWIQKFVTTRVDFEKVSGAVKKISGIFTDGFVPALKKVVDWIGKFVSNNVFGLFGKLFKKTSDDVKKGTASIKDATANFSFKDFIGNIGDAFKDGLDKLAHLDFGKILSDLKKGFENVWDFLGDVKDKIGEAFENIGKAAEESNISFEGLGKKIAEGFVTVVSTIGTFGPKIIRAIADAIASAFSNIGEMLPKPNSLGAAIGDFIADVISFIMKSIPYLVGVIASSIRVLISRLPGIIKELGVAVKDALDKALFEPIVVGTGKYKRTIPPLFDGITEVFKSLGKQFENATIDDMLGWVNKILTAGVLNQLRKTLKSGSKLGDNIGDFLGDLGKSIDKKLNGGLVDKFATLAAAVKDLAIGIAILAGAVVVLSYIPQKNLEKGGKALAAIGVGIALFCLALGGIQVLINKQGGGDSLSAMLEGLSGIFMGIAALMAAMTAISLVKADMKGPLLVLGLILVELGAFIFALKKIAPDSGELMGISTALGGYIDAIKGLMMALVVLAQMNPKKVYNAILELGLIIAELGGLVFVMSKIPVTTGGKAIVSLLPMLLMLGMALGALYLINKYELDPKQLMWVAGALGVISVIIVVLNKVGGGIAGGINAALAIVGFVGTIIAVITAVGAVIAAIDKLTGGGATKVLEASLNAFGNLMRMLGHALGEFAVGIGDAITEAMPGWAANISAFLIGLSPGLMALKGLGKDVGANVKAVAEAIAALAGAGLKDAISNFLGGGNNYEQFGQELSSLFAAIDQIRKGMPKDEGDLKTFSSQMDSMTQIADVIDKLSSIEGSLQSEGGLMQLFTGTKDFSQFTKGVKNLFSGFKEVGEAAGGIKNIKKISQLSSIAKTLSDTLAAMPDVDTMAYWVSTGTDKGLATLGKDLVAFGESVQKFLSSFEGQNTDNMKSVVKDIKKSMNDLSKAASKKSFTKGFSSVGSGAVDGIASGMKDTSKVSSTLNKSLKSALKNVSTDSFRKKGKECMTAFANGFKDAKVDDKAKELAKSAANALAANSIVTSANTSGGNVGKGFVNGISTQAMKSAAYNAGYTLGDRALDGIKAAIAQGSPSRKAMKSGKFFGEGFAIGIRKYVNKVYRVGEDLGGSAVNGLKRSISDIKKTVNDNLTSPTIRPVLDLSNVKMGLNSLDSMMTNSYALGLAGSMPTANVSGSKSITFNNRITVDGTADPTEWADEFMQELEIQARTL